MRDILPNFTVFDANNTRMPKFSVRGLRENSFGAGQSAVGMYVDGVPYSDMLSRGLSLYDVDHIEFCVARRSRLVPARRRGVWSASRLANR